MIKTPHNPTRKHYSLKKHYIKLGYEAAITDLYVGFYYVIAMDKKNKEILLISVKPDKFLVSQKLKLREAYFWLKEDYKIKFIENDN